MLPASSLLVGSLGSVTGKCYNTVIQLNISRLGGDEELMALNEVGDELCELCNESLGEPSGGTCYCLCTRCLGCATLWIESAAEENIDPETDTCTSCSE